jgi:hypothetical protein
VERRQPPSPAGGPVGCGMSHRTNEG